MIGEEATVDRKVYREVKPWRRAIKNKFEKLILAKSEHDEVLFANQVSLSLTSLMSAFTDVDLQDKDILVSTVDSKIQITCIPKTHEIVQYSNNFQSVMQKGGTEEVKRLCALDSDPMMTMHLFTSFARINKRQSKPGSSIIMEIKLKMEPPHILLSEIKRFVEKVSERVASEIFIKIDEDKTLCLHKTR